MTVRRNILAGWLAHALTLVVGLFLVRYVKDTLGDAGYGAWIFVSSVAGYAGLLYAGFGAAICRYTTKHHTLGDWESLNEVASSIFSVYAINSLIAMAGAVVFALVAPWVSDWEGQTLGDVRWTILLIGLSTMVGMLGSVFGGILVGIHRFDINRAIQISGTLVRLGLVVGFLHLRPGLVSMAAAFLVVTVVENVAYVVCAKRLLPTLAVHWRRARLATLKECMPFVSWNAVGMVSDYLIYLTDTVVIGVLLGTAAVTPYYIALRLCQMVRMPLEQVAEAVLPKAGELHARQRSVELRSLVTRSMGLALLLSGGFMIGATYFGERLITTWLGVGNEASPPILLILLAAQVFTLPLQVPRKALLGIGDVRWPATIDLMQAVLNLGLSLVLVRSWGIAGVAWGTFIPMVAIDLGILLPYVCRKLEIPVSQLIGDVVAPQVLPFAVLLGFCELASRLDLRLTWINLVGITVTGGALLLATRGAGLLIERSRRHRTTLAAATSP